ncbi:MAG: PQQ-binding-like beta-propeller repeat protein [Planctomycetaceae bacterium]
MFKAFQYSLAACLFTSVVASHLFAVEPKPSPVRFEATDWPWWRGPGRNGIAAADQDLPLSWSAAENVLWKAPVAGRGHGSPTVVGEQVFLATADEQADRQLVLCFDRLTGKQVWQTLVHDGGIERKGNQKSSQASSTIACDGERLFINFLNRGAVYTTALSRGGEILWQQKITDYVEHQGYGSSPAIYDSLVIVCADSKGEGGGAIAGLNRATGDVVWRHGRPATPNYPSPIILNAAGRDQVLLTGCNLVASFAPLTGDKLWEVAGATTECVTSTVTDGNIILTSGGYPKNHMSAVRADGSGEVVWENNVRVYVPSMLIHEGTLYGVTDAGVAMCWEAATGKELWKGRLGGTFSASPVMVGEHIFATDEAGETSVFKADPAKFELVAKNQLGTEVFATPTFCGSRIYMRVAEQQGDRRQEMLYCLGDD